MNTLLLIFLAACAILSLYLQTNENKRDRKNRRATYLSSWLLYEGNLLINSIKGKLNFMAVTLTDTQKASGVLKFVDKKGKDTDVPDGSVAVTSSDDAVATVTYDDPSNKVEVVAVSPGVAALHFDIKDKNGNALPFEDIAVEVKSGDAVSGTVVFGAPEEQE